MKINITKILISFTQIIPLFFLSFSSFASGASTNLNDSNDQLVFGAVAAVGIGASVLLLSSHSSSDNLSDKTSSLYYDLQQTIDNFRKVHEIPAIEIALSLPGEPTILNFVSGSTTIDGKNKLTPGDLYQFGSTTKSFTAVLILQLEAEGKLGPRGVNETIGQFLPERPPYLQWKDITIRQLLNHTSGIFDAHSDNNFQNEVRRNPNKLWTPEEEVAIAANHEPYFKVPGKGWHYSNTNYILLGEIIKKVTGNSYENELNQRLLGSENLNLINTYFANVYSDDVTNHMVHGYYKTLSGYQDVTSPNISWSGPAGGIVSNAQDFVRWVLLLLQQGKVLDSTHLTEMKDLVCANPNSNCIPGERVSPEIGGYGYGIGEITEEGLGNIWTHDGSTFGYSTEYMWIPNFNIALVVAMNINNGPTDELLSSVLRVLAQYNKISNVSRLAIPRFSN